MKKYVKHDATKIKSNAIDVQIICALAARAVSMPASQEVEITVVSLEMPLVPDEVVDCNEI